MTFQAGYKPSPLSIGSPRTSPFRRPESPSTPVQYAASPAGSNTTPRPVTPSTSPTKLHHSTFTSPTRLQNNATTPTSAASPAWSPRGLTPSSPNLQENVPLNGNVAASFSTAGSVTPTTSHTASSPVPVASLSQLPAPVLNQLRQSFSFLDRTSTGTITRADVTATLSELGLPATSTEISAFFPPGAPQQLPLAQFLATLGNPLSQFSREEELMNAFGAFDEKDCGEIDKDVLMDALLHTGGERALSQQDIAMALEGFTGKKAFGKGGGMDRGEVFRYREWVGGILGGPEKEVAA